MLSVQVDAFFAFGLMMEVLLLLYRVRLLVLHVTLISVAYHAVPTGSRARFATPDHLRRADLPT